MSFELETAVARLGIPPDNEALIEILVHIEELYAELDEVEDLIQWCIDNEALVRFGSRVAVTVHGATYIAPTLWDCVHDLKKVENDTHSH